MFDLIFKHREATHHDQTRERVFHLIYKPLEVISIKYEDRVCHISCIQTQEGVFYLISKHLEVIYETRKGLFHLISKHPEVII